METLRTIELEKFRKLEWTVMFNCPDILTIFGATIKTMLIASAGERNIDSLFQCSPENLKIVGFEKIRPLVDLTSYRGDIAAPYNIDRRIVIDCNVCESIVFDTRFGKLYKGQRIYFDTVRGLGLSKLIGWSKEYSSVMVGDLTLYEFINCGLIDLKSVHIKDIDTKNLYHQLSHKYLHLEYPSDTNPIDWKLTFDMIAGKEVPPKPIVSVTSAVINESSDNLIEHWINEAKKTGVMFVEDEKPIELIPFDSFEEEPAIYYTKHYEPFYNDRTKPLAIDFSEDAKFFTQESVNYGVFIKDEEDLKTIIKFIESNKVSHNLLPSFRVPFYFIVLGPHKTANVIEPTVIKNSMIMEIPLFIDLWTERWKKN